MTASEDGAIQSCCDTSRSASDSADTNEFNADRLRVGILFVKLHSFLANDLSPVALSRKNETKKFMVWNTFVISLQKSR